MNRATQSFHVARQPGYLPFVEPEVPIYPVEHHLADRTDDLALIILCLVVIGLVGYASQHVNGVINAFSVILTLVGVLAMACLIYAVSSLVYRD